MLRPDVKNKTAPVRAHENRLLEGRTHLRGLFYHLIKQPVETMTDLHRWVPVSTLQFQKQPFLPWDHPSFSHGKAWVGIGVHKCCFTHPV